MFLKDLLICLIFQVDINNLEEYISLVVDATVKTGIMRQMEAFRSGFNQVSSFLCYLWISCGTSFCYTWLTGLLIEI